MDHDYDEAKQLLIAGLRHDIVAHEAQQYHEIGHEYALADARVPRSSCTRFDQLSIALNFWDGWIDARNHQWAYYRGIAEADWPHLARHIVEALTNDAAITDLRVLNYFCLSVKPSLLDRVKRVFSRRHRA